MPITKPEQHHGIKTNCRPISRHFEKKITSSSFSYHVHVCGHTHYLRPLPPYRKRHQSFPAINSYAYTCTTCRRLRYYIYSTLGPNHLSQNNPLTSKKSARWVSTPSLTSSRSLVAYSSNVGTSSDTVLSLPSIRATSCSE